MKLSAPDVRLSVGRCLPDLLCKNHSTLSLIEPSRSLSPPYHVRNEEDEELLNGFHTIMSEEFPHGRFATISIIYLLSTTCQKGFIFSLLLLGSTSELTGEAMREPASKRANLEMR